MRASDTAKASRKARKVAVQEVDRAVATESSTGSSGAGAGNAAMLRPAALMDGTLLSMVGPNISRRVALVASS